MSGSSQPADFARLYGSMCAKGEPVILCTHKFNLFFIREIKSHGRGVSRRFSVLKCKRSDNEDKQRRIISANRIQSSK